MRADLITGTQQADEGESLFANAGFKIILRCDYPRNGQGAARLMQLEEKWLRRGAPGPGHRAAPHPAPRTIPDRISPAASQEHAGIRRPAPLTCSARRWLDDYRERRDLRRGEALVPPEPGTPF